MGTQKTENGSSKGLIYLLLAVTVVLAIVLIVVWATKARLVKDLKAEKTELTEQVKELQNDYATLSSDYETLNAQLDSSREEVSQLITRIQKTEATNRAKMRQYEKELGTLRAIMRNYLVQIDSLNTLNHKLMADAEAAKADAAANRRKNEELNKTVNHLSGQVEAGSVVKSRALTINAYNSSDKITDRSSRVVRLVTNVNLIENDLASKGALTVYIRVKDPEGVLLTNAKSREFTVKGEKMIASASREVDYQGSEVEMNIYLNDIPSYTKGTYTVEAYTAKGLLGTAELALK